MEKSVYRIYNETLVECCDKSIKTAMIPEGVTRIAYSAFERCAVEEVFLPNSLKVIGHSAFSDCEKLKKVHFGNNLELIAQRAFDDCYSLKSVELPSSLKTLGEAAWPFVDEIKIPHLVDGLAESFSLYSPCNQRPTYTLKLIIGENIIRMPRWMEATGSFAGHILSCCDSSNPDYQEEKKRSFCFANGLRFQILSAAEIYLDAVKSNETTTANEAKIFLQKEGAKAIILLAEDMSMFAKLLREDVFSFNSMYKAWETLSKNGNPEFSAYLLQYMRRTDRASIDITL